MMPKSKLSRDQWLALIAQFAESGLAVAEFCAAKDVSAHSFYQWKRKAEGRPMIQHFGRYCKSLSTCKRGLDDDWLDRRLKDFGRKLPKADKRNLIL